MKNRSRTIVVVTDEDETLALEFVELDDLRNEGILPQNPAHFADQ
jgi:hypothetical protein